MTTARIKYRIYVPDDWIAVSFCDVDFSGDNAEEYKQMWHDIEYEKCDKYRNRLCSLITIREQYKNERRSILTELAANKKWWRLYHTAHEKVLNKKLADINNSIKTVKKEIKRIEKDRFYDDETLVKKAEDFLNKKGFVLISSASSGDDGVCTDIWSKEKI